MGSDFINLGLKNVWKAWKAFRKGKRTTNELHFFEYYLEDSLLVLHRDLNMGGYSHGPYQCFTVCDNKKREISVAPIRDRVVHRLLYDYLVPIWDKTFIYDAWSCRKGKGLLGAIERVQGFMRSFPRAYLWRGDVKKFFDSVDQEILFRILRFRVKDERALKILREVIESYSSFHGAGKGMPIGNLTSQVFANIYLNEFDMFVKHRLKPSAYLRYGDDFVVFGESREEVKGFRDQCTTFLEERLLLQLNPKNVGIFKARQGLRFLGVWLWPNGRSLTKRNLNRIHDRLNLLNAPSYHGLMAKHETLRRRKHFDWMIGEQLI